jgi:hypothetical protein
MYLVVILRCSRDAKWRKTSKEPSVIRTHDTHPETILCYVFTGF